MLGRQKKHQRNGCLKRNPHFIKSGLFLLIFLSFSFTTYGGRIDDLYFLAAKKYRQLYEKTEYRKFEHNWLKTIDEFELIYKTFPKNPLAAKSLFNIGKLYRSLYRWNHKNIFLDKSSLTFRKMIKKFPSHFLADDAQFLLAENYEIFKKDKDLAFLEYRKVLEKFPRGDQAKEAKKKLKKLQPPDIDLELTNKNDPEFSTLDLSKPRYGGIPEKDRKKQKKLVKITKANYWSTSEWSRLVIDSKDEIRYKYQSLKPDPRIKKGKRFYLDLFNTFIPTGFKKTIAANDGLIKRARIAQFDKKTVRVVLDLASLKKLKVFSFKLPNQNKIVIDMSGSDFFPDYSQNKPLEELSPPTEKEPASNFNTKNPGDVSLADVFGLKVRTIVLDPGHGGKDNGSSGFGLREKNIVLRIALQLEKIIKQRHSDIQVLLTRRKDEFISLEARTGYANKKKGDLFVSIHLNASRKKQATGLETYFLNLTSDTESLELAARENQVSQKSISDLQNILNDLMTSTKIKESGEVADFIHFSMLKWIQNSGKFPIRDRGVKKAPFIVLLGSEMPSILVEAGFLTNPKENKLLKTTKYQRVISEGIYNGIKEYINRTSLAYAK